MCQTLTRSVYPTSKGLHYEVLFPAIKSGRRRRRAEAHGAETVTEDQLVEATIDKEGRTYGDQTTHPPIDQPTAPGGVILNTLSAYLGRQASLAELKALTVRTARPIVLWELRQLAVAFRLNLIAFEPLRVQMLDWAYNSGPGTAIKWLQSVLRVDIDGTIGPLTLAALNRQDPWLVNQALVGARLQFIDRWTDKAKQRMAWEEGLESRGLLFSLLEIPKGY